MFGYLVGVYRVDWFIISLAGKSVSSVFLVSRVHQLSSLLVFTWAMTRRGFKRPSLVQWLFTAVASLELSIVSNV